MPNPLSEVFGYPIDDFSEAAERHRRLQLCPFHNKVPNCTKDKAKDPLGTCSIRDANDDLVITCPIRFREDWLIAEHAAAFFFPEGTRWTSLTEVRLNDRHGRSAGNIDIVLVAYDERGRIIDFGALEVQAVYISGNIRRPFEIYMEAPEANYNMNWPRGANFPRPDFLSSSRKRLAPQLIFKGGILKAWGKKQAVVVDRPFWQSLPRLTEVEPGEAELAWLIYDLLPDEITGQLRLTLYHAAYTQFKPALDSVTTSEAGLVEDFVEVLQDKLDRERGGGGSPPDAPSLSDILGLEP